MSEIVKFEMDISSEDSYPGLDRIQPLIDEDSCDSGFDSNESENETSPLSRRFIGKRSGPDEDEDLWTGTVSQPVSEASIGGVSSFPAEEVLNTQLIGDCSRVHSLPTVQGRHSDLVSVTPSTVGHLLDGQYDDVISGYQIIDCRYPYEYEGGHIAGGVNLHCKEMINDFLLRRQHMKSTGRNVLIVHCEFSIERGPTLLRHLRSMDRKLNSDRYPFLFFPEVYLLDGGYSAFFEENKVHCQPQSYLPMVHENFSKQLRHFRVKAKSWSAGDKLSLRSRRQQRDLFPKKLLL